MKFSDDEPSQQPAPVRVSMNTTTPEMPPYGYHYVEDVHGFTCLAFCNTQGWLRPKCGDIEGHGTYTITKTMSLEEGNRLWSKAALQ